MFRFSNSLLCFLVALLLLSSSAKLAIAAQSQSKNTKPNIIFIFADDMGYGDVQALNPESQVPTPNLNKLAKQGMTFTDAHTASAVCTPSRYALLTGRYCWRSRLKRGVLMGYSSRLIEQNRKTVADLLKANGYHTAVIGKWHLGLDWTRTGKGKKAKVDFTKPVANGPNTLGFDYSYIVPASLDMAPYTYVENDHATELPTANNPQRGFPKYTRKGPRAPSFDMENALDHLTQKATSFIAKNAKTNQPFFLYFPLTAPHKPVWPHPRFQGKTKLGDYADFVTQVDWTVGQILNAIDKANITDNTIVFYSSDNGSFMFRLDDPSATDHVTKASIQAYRADHHRANHIFRGTKADIWEAGHHVPFFVRWPGQIKAGSVAKQTVCMSDFLATCADIVGAKLNNDTAEDSFSLLPLLKNNKWDAPRPPVIHHSANGIFAIRDGKWKLIAGNGSGGREKPSGRAFQKPYQLFDMSKDVSETTNVIEQHPDVAERLTQTLEQFRATGRSVQR